MDFSEALIEYFNSILYIHTEDHITVRKINDSEYIVNIKYGDEEIESHLGDVLKMSLKISDLEFNENENYIWFYTSLLYLTIPGLCISGDNDYEFIGCSLLQEVAKMGCDYLKQANIDRPSIYYIN